MRVSRTATEGSRRDSARQARQLFSAEEPSLHKRTFPIVDHVNLVALDHDLESLSSDRRPSSVDARDPESSDVLASLKLHPLAASEWLLGSSPSTLESLALEPVAKALAWWKGGGKATH